VSLLTHYKDMKGHTEGRN